MLFLYILALGLLSNSPFLNTVSLLLFQMPLSNWQLTIQGISSTLAQKKELFRHVQRERSNTLNTFCWLSCDGLASHPGGVVILLVTLCWVSCDGLASHPGGVVILLVTLCWVSCDGLASHPGGSSNTPSHFMLGIL